MLIKASLPRILQDGICFEAKQYQYMLDLNIVSRPLTTKNLYYVF
jgi:hypothetical protein